MEDRLSCLGGRQRKISDEKFSSEYNKFQSGQYGDISRKQFAELMGISRCTFERYEKNMKTFKRITKQEKKELKVLADDFGLLHREDVQDIIENCKSYIEGQQGILRIYTDTYLN